MTPTETIRPPDDIITAFENELVGYPGVVVGRSTLWALWNQADVAWAGTPAARHRLAYALERLADNATVELPARGGRAWDTAIPSLPGRVALPANRRPPGRPLNPADEPWSPLLAWVPGWIRTARPPQRLRVAAARINRWVLQNTGRSPERVAREERSLHIFDDEKTLAALSGGVLFAPGRLTFDQLACDAPFGGLRIARLASDGPVLVVENKSTFDSAWRALRAARRPPYAAVVFGAGDAVVTIVGDLANLDALVGVTATTLHYAGDVDVAGIEAATTFRCVAEDAGLRVDMAMPLWEAVAMSTPTGEDLTADRRRTAGALAAADALDLPSVVGDRLREGVRVPQERVDRVALARLDWWTP